LGNSLSLTFIEKIFTPRLSVELINFYNQVNTTIYE